MRRDLRLVKKKFSKPTSSTLVAKDGTTLSHVVSLDALPVVPLSPASSDTTLSDEDLSTPLSEEEIHTAISKLTSGRAPGLDGITLEMLSLGGDATVRWLKAIFDTIWATESVPED